MRTATIKRETAETQIELFLNLDHYEQQEIATGVGFLDHMLDLLSFHGQFTLRVKANADLHVDDHHLVEDLGIVLGEAFTKALGDKQGINRYASVRLPMDESLAAVDLDFSGRSYLHYDLPYTRSEINGFALENVQEFFMGFVREARATLHIRIIYGENNHHMVEAIFKACGRALAQGSKIVSDYLPSTKKKL